MKVPGLAFFGRLKRGAAQPREQGFALLIVLWSVGLLALFGSQLVSSGHREAQRASNMRLSAAAEAAADGAVYQCIFHLLQSGAGHWAPNGTYHLVVGRIAVDVTIRSVSGLVNPNTASLALMQALLQEIGTPKARSGALAAAILDWRTPGEFARPDGAKAPEYRAGGYTYGPPDAPFQDLSELGGVLGMTPELLARLLPHLSINAPEAPSAVLSDPTVSAALHDAGETGGGLDEGDTIGTVSINATGIGPGGSRFLRHVVITTDDATNRQVFRTLMWEQPGEP
jgi:general secretion pathway protein K